MLFPKKLKERLLEEKKTKEWDVVQKPLIADVLKALKDHEKEAAKPNDENGDGMKNKLMKEELEARLEVLNNAEKTYTPLLIPMFDCVVFHDGHSWR